MINGDLTRQPQVFRARQHGLTLLEFLIALMITALISITMCSMVMAVARATELDSHTRETVVRSQAVAVRLISYITPSQCILESTKSDLVIWLDDSRESDTVHATEVRWIKRDASTGTIELHYVKFPNSMTQVERDLLDVELPVATTDWWLTLQSYEATSYTAKIRLCDSVDDFNVHRDALSEQGKRLVTFTIQYDAAIGSDEITTAACVREWKEPTS